MLFGDFAALKMDINKFLKVGFGAAHTPSRLIAIMVGDLMSLNIFIATKTQTDSNHHRLRPR